MSGARPELIKGTQRWAGRVLDLLYPRHCAECHVPLTETEPGVICPGCLAATPWIERPYCERCSLPFDGVDQTSFRCGYCADLPFHFDRAVAACRARGMVRNALHRFKYDRQMHFGPHLRDWLVTGTRDRVDWDAVDGIVPVPLHPRKRRHRQFNQAEYLADAVGAAYAKPVWSHAVRRVRDTATQTFLGAAERRANLRRAFQPGRRGGMVTGQRVALVDDVFTTGATLDACAKVLGQAGAANVIVLTVARGV